MKHMRITVAGCGSQGNAHLSALSSIEEVSVVAVCDPRRERAEEACERYGITACPAYTDYAVMIAKEKPDVVTLATPVVFHEEQAVAAFEAGAHVVCEKPLAMNAGQAENIIGAAKRNDRKLGMGLQSRYSPEGAGLKQFISEGHLGDIFHARLFCGHQMHIPGHGELHRRDMSGGGVLFATAVHPVDMAVWLMDNPEPVRVSAQAYQRIHRMKEPPIGWRGKLEDCDVEDFCSGIVHFATGAALDFYSDWLMHENPHPFVEVIGNYGRASLDPLKVTLDDGSGFSDVSLDVLKAGRGSIGGINGILRDFFRCIRDDETPRYRFSEMRNVQRIMDGAYRSVKEGREVEV